MAGGRGGYEGDDRIACVWRRKGEQPVYWLVAGAQVFELFCSKLQTSVCILPFHNSLLFTCLLVYKVRRQAVNISGCV